MKLREILRLCLAAGTLLLVVEGSPALPEDYETARTSNAAILNRLGLVPVLSLLPAGETSGHQRKRLALQQQAHHHPTHAGGRDVSHSRRHGADDYDLAADRKEGPVSLTPRDDSHVFVVKLPAGAPYYSLSKPHEPGSKPSLSKTVNPGFRSNGKPAKIFHWNLPLVKKINEKKKHLAAVLAERERLKVAEKMNYFKKLAQEQLVAEAIADSTSGGSNGGVKPTRNNDKWLSHPEHVEPRPNNYSDSTSSQSKPSVQLKSPKQQPEKSYRVSGGGGSTDEESSPRNGMHQQRTWHQNQLILQQRNSGAPPSSIKVKHRKKSAFPAVSYYYAPRKLYSAVQQQQQQQAKSVVPTTSISKNFSGNGKPKAFYVMEKSRKPVYYHPLLP